MRPVSLPDAFDLMARYGDDAKLLAGGQSLVPALNMRLSAPRVLIDINGLQELKGIRVTGDRVVVGALTRHRELENSPEIAAQVPLLRQAIRHVAHAAIRNRGTFGGSIANADPAAELPACAVALDAEFRIASGSGERRVAAREFFKGLYETDLRPGEMLVAGEFPRLQPGYRSAFQELARRQGDYAIVGLAAHARIEPGVIRDARLVFFGVGAMPVAAGGAERVLEGNACTPETIAAARRELASGLDPSADLYHSAETKRHLAGVLLARVLTQLAGAPG